MKKKYILPEAVVFACNTNSLLMASTLDAMKDDLSVILTEEEFDSEFSSRYVELEDDIIDL